YCSLCDEGYGGGHDKDCHFCSPERIRLDMFWSAVTTLVTILWAVALLRFLWGTNSGKPEMPLEASRKSDLLSSDNLHLRSVTGAAKQSATSASTGNIHTAVNSPRAPTSVTDQ
ncbi:unnamed protein product, partial [Chrysoparadoxa australica]